MRHKHADLIHEWAEGAEIQYRNKYNDFWHSLSANDSVLWTEADYYEYRIKPAPKPDVVWYANPRIDGDICSYMRNIPWAGSNLKLTFDGETGELKSAEIIK